MFFSPTSMTALEILIATRAMRGTLDTAPLAGMSEAIARIADAIGHTTPHSTASPTWCGRARSDDGGTDGHDRPAAHRTRTASPGGADW